MSRFPLRDALRRAERDGTLRGDNAPRSAPAGSQAARKAVQPFKLGDPVFWLSSSLGARVPAQVIGVGAHKIKIRYRFAGNQLERWVLSVNLEHSQ